MHIKMESRIIELEKSNDGQTIHLFYNDLQGQYQAFGLSAYYTTIVTDPNAVYSEEMEMPVVMLKRAEVLQLRQSMSVMEHEPKSYYRFQLRHKVGKRWYQTWVNNLRKSG